MLKIYTASLNLIFYFIVVPSNLSFQLTSWSRNKLTQITIVRLVPDNNLQAHDSLTYEISIYRVSGAATSKLNQNLTKIKSFFRCGSPQLLMLCQATIWNSINRQILQCPFNYTDSTLRNKELTELRFFINPIGKEGATYYSSHLIEKCIIKLFRINSIFGLLDRIVIGGASYVQRHLTANIILLSFGIIFTHFCCITSSFWYYFHFCYHPFCIIFIVLTVLLPTFRY